MYAAVESPPLPFAFVELEEGLEGCDVVGELPGVMFVVPTVADVTLEWDVKRDAEELPLALVAG